MTRWKTAALLRQHCNEQSRKGAADMKQSISRAVWISILMAALGAALPSFAQGDPARKAAPAPGPGYETTEDMRRFQKMAEVMRDMSEEMSGIQQEMAKGELSPEMRKQMSRQLKDMAGMMQRMSALTDRPSMKGAEMEKQVEEMRKQMDQMKRRHR
jgi:Asp-tRNA(Asn)/Glu-tRNA(Gln) amidotransferase C subunit